jgi:DNA invertase Pin-like site-specific DNA recombinase
MLQALEEFPGAAYRLCEPAGVDRYLHTTSDASSFTVVAAFSELEKGIIKERVQAGVDRARSEGKRLGRPTVIIDRERVRQCAVQGQSIKSIAKENGIARSTVRDILGRARVAKSPLQSQKSKSLISRSRATAS